MYQDLEINALSNVYEALKGCNRSQIKRIIDWITGKFELDLQTVQKEVELPSEPTPVEAAEPAAAPVVKRRGRRPRQVGTSEIKGFMKFHSLEEVVEASTVKRSGEKMLLAAAYLQEKENLKELNSYDISSRLRKIGVEVKHPSPAISVLINKKPPLLIQVGKMGTGSKSRRKFRVTEEGLRIARNYISE